MDGNPCRDIAVRVRILPDPAFALANNTNVAVLLQTKTAPNGNSAVISILQIAEPRHGRGIRFGSRRSPTRGWGQPKCQGQPDPCVGSSCLCMMQGLSPNTSCNVVILITLTIGVEMRGGGGQTVLDSLFPVTFHQQNSTLKFSTQFNNDSTFVLVSSN